jgi:hypothetical protein
MCLKIFKIVLGMGIKMIRCFPILFTLLFFLTSHRESHAFENGITGLVSIESGIGDGPGNTPGYQGLDLFLAAPKLNDYLYPFLNQTFYRLNDNRFASTTGIGVRWVTPYSGIILGTNLFYDYLQLHRGSFNQLGIGFEVLGRCLDFRCNGYQPIGNKSHHLSTCVFDQFIGDFVMIKRRFKTVMEGLDGEFALHLARREGFDLYICGGSYYYHSKPSGHCWGGSARIGLDYHRYIRIEGSYYSDNLFGQNFQGIIRLSLPFNICYSAQNCLWDILMQPIERHPFAFSRNHCCWSSNF